MHRFQHIFNSHICLICSFSFFQWHFMAIRDKIVADQGSLMLSFTYMARFLDPGLQCGPGLVGLATNNKTSHLKYDLKQPINMNNV